MTIHATFEGGVFKPKEAVELPEGCEVEFEPKPIVPSAAEETILEREIRWLTSRTPEEIEATRLRLSAKSTPGRPLPPGKTLADMVEGKWPGDEPDEEIREMLEKLS